MADSKASALTAASALSGTELWAIAQGGADRKVTASQVATYINAQPLDSDLTAIAALATTAYGRALLTLANAAAADWLAKTGGTLTGALDVQAEVRCDSLRIDAAPTGTSDIPATHKVAVNLNGTTYYLLASNV